MSATNATASDHESAWHSTSSASDSDSDSDHTPTPPPPQRPSPGMRRACASKIWWRCTTRAGLRHGLYTDPLVSSGLRVIQLVCNVAALALAANVFRSFWLSTQQTMSVVTTIAVASIASPYLIYTTRHEWRNHPQSDPVAKARQLLLDVVFINVATLNFGFAVSASLTEQDFMGSNMRLHSQSIGLVVLLAIIMVAWMLTFAVNMLRSHCVPVAWEGGNDADGVVGGPQEDEGGDAGPRNDEAQEDEGGEEGVGDNEGGEVEDRNERCGVAGMTAMTYEDTRDEIPSVETP
ncbi:MAG: hypothetical protein Q9168_002149 [Polycauliona sp. 1 TL-2023]